MPTKVISNLNSGRASKTAEVCPVLPVVIEPKAEVVQAVAVKVEEPAKPGAVEAAEAVAAEAEVLVGEQEAEETPAVLKAKPRRRRARKVDGQFQADDPATPENEAFVAE